MITLEEGYELYVEDLWNFKGNEFLSVWLEENITYTKDFANNENSYDKKYQSNYI